MAFAAPVSIAPAGTGGLLTGAGGMSGVEGLFTSLLSMDGQSVAVPQTGGVAADIRMEQGGGAGGGLMKTLLPVADTQVKVQGDGGVVAAFAQRVQELYQQVVESGMLMAGGSDATKQLAAALQNMGIPAEQAAGIAEQIDTMIAMVEQQQGRELTDEEAAGLAAMMLAALVPHDSGKAFNIVISAKDDQATVSVAQVDDAFKKGALLSPADMARQMAGLDANVAEKVAMPVNKADAPTGFSIDVTHTDAGEATVTVTLPDAARTAEHVAKVQIDPVAPKSTAGQMIDESLLATQDVQRIEADKVLERARGETLYKMQADKDGLETLQAVRPVTDSGAAAAAALGSAANPAAVHAGADGGDGAMAFTERLALAQRNHAADQIAIQVKPLLENGGGQVRMTLNPPELGRITIDLQISNGKVHGAISSTDAAVVEHLARELHNLRHGLAEAGLKLGEQGISLMLNDSNQFAQGQNQGHGQQQARGGSTGAVEELVGADIMADASAWVSPERVVDVKI